MGSLGSLPIPPNTDQVHRVPISALQAKLWLLHRAMFVQGGGGQGVVLQLLFTG